MKIHPDILRLGAVSLLTDLSSEMIFSVFAIFFTSVAGASAALLGLVEGLADFAASGLTFVAGWLSDRQGRRKAFAIAGYGFSTLAKTILLVSSSIAGLCSFRVLERLGKGMRGPPRDAWLSSIADPATRGLSFGVHKALDKSGAVLGPLLAWGLLTALGETPAGYRALFWLAVLPALASVALLFTVREAPATARPATADRAASRPALPWRGLSPGVRRFLLPSALFALGYYSLGFLMLKAHAVGFTIKDTVLLYALFNVTCVVSAPLAGHLGDRIGRSRVVLLGYALYGLLNLGAIFAQGPLAIGALFAVYGVFYAIDDSQSRAFIADLEPVRRATAVGAYNFVTGTMYLLASLIAGALWTLAPAAAFGCAALLSLAAIVSFAAVQPARVDGPA